VDTVKGVGRAGEVEDRWREGERLMMHTERFPLNFPNRCFSINSWRKSLLQVIRFVGENRSKEMDEKPRKVA
jgi:hypothetical protein